MIFNFVIELSFFLKIHILFATFTVPLGSIREVPAASCQGIKASEGTSAVSGNYWLDSIKADLAVLVPCDMGTGGVFLRGIREFR